MINVRRTLLLMLALQPIAIGLAAAPVVVGQLHRAFTVRDLHVARGETVKFTNTDEFIHHLYVHSDAFNFNSGEQPPGRDVDIRFPAAGAYEVRCEIHPRMQVKVTVD